MDGRLRRLPRRAVRQRAPAVRPLHQRLDGQAQGRPAHLRRLPARRQLHAPARLRPARGGRLLVYGRLRLDHGAQLRRLRPARQRRDDGDVRGRAEPPARGPLLGDHREVPRQHLLHRADGDPRLHQVGRPLARRATTCRACALLGTVGEPINPEAWMWYHEVIGGERCPIVDTWWQTETGMILIAPLPGAIATKPGSRDAADPRRDRRRGRQARRAACRPTRGGLLVVKKPWPAMLRTIFGDDARYREQYWSQVPGVLLHRRRRRARTRTATSGSWAGSTTC